MVLSIAQEYIIKVQRGYAVEESWETTHRYSEFADLHKHLTVSDLLPLCVCVCVCVCV